jgi:hypothetical protein
LQPSDFSEGWKPDGSHSSKLARSRRYPLGHPRSLRGRTASVPPAVEVCTTEVHAASRPVLLERHEPRLGSLA